MPTGHVQHYAAAYDSSIYIVGGVNTANEYTSVIDIYNRYTESWSTEILWIPRAKPAVVAAEGKLFIAGGVVFQPREHFAAVEISHAGPSPCFAPPRGALVSSETKQTSFGNGQFFAISMEPRKPTSSARVNSP